ncbi:MAG: hypothetical protein R3F53_28335 [Gammaproteobacteria bacterium]
MRKPSRLIPSAISNRMPWLLGWWLSALGLYVALWALVNYPLVIGPLIVLSFALSKLEKQRLKRIADSRSEESICQFARAFDARTVDTRIIRAVYDELSAYLDSRASPFPLRASDQLFHRKGLNIDEDDLNDLVLIIAQRAGRSIENTQDNPFTAK